VAARQAHNLQVGGSIPSLATTASSGESNKKTTTMSVTLVEKHSALKKSHIVIRPFFDGSRENLGLEKYGMTLFDGVMHEEQLACLEFNGVKRYLTGLNEFAPEIKMIQDEDEKAAKVKEIRVIVSDLEKALGSNVVDPTDEHFWSKLITLKPDNSAFWDKIFIRVGNEPLHLDPKDPIDLIRLKAIEAGGFSMVAKSLEDARGMSQAPKFYLDKQEDTAAIVTEVKKLKAKALSELQKLFDKHQNKMFLVAKVVDANSLQYKKSTPNDVIYDNLFEYIEGNRADTNKRKAAEKFIAAVGLDAETLKVRALIKDANYLKVAHTKADGYIYHMPTSTLMGKNPSDVLEFLKNPLNEDVLRAISTEVEKYWNL
jgi:hypothetical protein